MTGKLSLEFIEKRGQAFGLRGVKGDLLWITESMYESCELTWSMAPKFPKTLNVSVKESSSEHVE